ncbi:fluoride efflux transporter CrcB [Pontibacillus halophilus]|nr:fluoride efflux transporter CrcB [Pontibacillus halophilus]
MQGIWVLIGGAVGSLARYSLSFIHGIGLFPYGTLFANLIGCFLLSFLINLPLIKVSLPQSLRVGVGTGVIGGFTTFSTFSLELAQLLNQSKFSLGFLYLFVSIIGGLFLSWLGLLLANRQEAK